MMSAFFERLFPDAAEPLGDFTATRRMLPVAVLAAGIGVLSAYVARALLQLIGLFTHLFFFGRFDTSLVSPAEHRLGGWVVLVPVVGGLLIGVLARYGSERIRGHGIPEALEAILMRGSRVEPRLAVLKPLSAAISIGSGGPFGAEGPIIMTGGAFGSLVAQAFHLTNAERKTLLVAGAAGGMTATFGSPLAAVLLAVELLLFEWKPRSFVPVMLSCAAAMTARQFLMPAGPLFHVPQHAEFIGVPALLGCGLAGAAAGAVSVAMTRSVYFFEDLFADRLRAVHWMWWPALAAVVIGIGGWIEPRVLGVGYDVIEDLLSGKLAWRAALLLLLIKWGIWSFSLGSGTSGGVLAPLLLVGAALGVLEGSLFPSVGSGFWPLISMGAILGGTMRSPLTGILFSLEVTHDWDALLPLCIAVAVAHTFTVLALRRSILTERVSRRGFHLTREYGVDPLEVLFVREVMRVDGLLPLAAGEIVAYPGETLRTVAQRMAHANVTRLNVVLEADPAAVIGQISLEEMLVARRRHQEEETRRERVLPLHLLAALRPRSR
jgi:H+/Cl- antiporter ClcA